MIQRVLSEAHTLDEFRHLWIESQERRKLINHLLGDNLSPDLLRDIDRMTDYDNYDLFAHHGYKARALKRPDRKIIYLNSNEPGSTRWTQRRPPCCAAWATSLKSAAPKRSKPPRSGRFRRSKSPAGSRP